MTLLAKSLQELTDWVREQGQPAYRGKQLHHWLYSKGARSVGEISVFPKAWRETLGDFPVGRSSVECRTVAPDSTRKYLLKLGDGAIVETVGIPAGKRLTVCVSSQVGCPMACDFCATGKTGYTRNLKAHEIVDQVLTVRDDFGERVSNVVFMGMGEPLLNLPEVVAAIHSLNRDVGIGQRCLTLSTVGIPDKIRQLAGYELSLTLAVSLHAPEGDLRERLLPGAARYPLEKLLEDCRDYVKLTGRRVTFEYILLAGVNDRPEQARELCRQIKGFQSHVNLIPYNPIPEVGYLRPDRRRIEDFKKVLEAARIAVSVRYSRGLEAEAACGQLRARKEGSAR